MTVLYLPSREEFGLSVVAGVPETRDTVLVRVDGVGSLETRPMVPGVSDSALKASGVPETALAASGVVDLEIALKVLASVCVLDCALPMMPAISSSSS